MEGTSKDYQTSIIAAIVALVAIMAGVLVGLAVTGHLDANSTPLLVTIFGIVGTTIVALLSVIRSDRTVIEVKRTNGDVASLTARLDALDAAATPPTTPTRPA